MWVCMCRFLCGGGAVDEGGRFGVASVCLRMTSCCFSFADGRCMWRPFDHGSGPVNGTGIRQSQAWVNQLPSLHGPDGPVPVIMNRPGDRALNDAGLRCKCMIVYRL